MVFAYVFIPSGAVFLASLLNNFFDDCIFAFIGDWCEIITRLIFVAHIIIVAVHASLIVQHGFLLCS